ncbi:hypothetical protein GPECTOR_63g16 [Gonium pectorale]|uniref:PI3K/PI4K catalytic domain-containing protein n=1 Tax=Gonium pectorale TaxID=33097 RepID=A0A150G4A3_GONPE|nr:hypothetical protein GPECTOR_63g16 [Gonium pectorale]|eukprot:KXZ44687.1 hypothetical protein GPECTOR_63g16 [Gonium pectorale]
MDTLALFLQCVHAGGASALPHVDTCNYCFECVPSPPGMGTAVAADATQTRHRHHRHSRRVLQQAAALDNVGGLTTGNIHQVGGGGWGGAGTGASGEGFSLGSGDGSGGGAGSGWSSEPDEAYEAAAAASGIPGAIVNPHRVQPTLIGPEDHDAKQRKPNCTRCTGCTTVLTDMHAAPVEAQGLGGLAFMHGKGATNGWLFFGHVPGSSKRYIVKVYCMPYSKAHGRPQECAASVYTERMRLMMAQVRLTDECGAGGITPRVWVAPVNAIIPNGTFTGYHVRWHGLWMEEAPGITLHGLYTTRGAEHAMYELLTKKMNRTQVVQQTVLDLLTAQCDRHSENVFITNAGQLSFIDNDRALGVVTRCGSDSMLLPGNRYHTQLRLGYWGQTLEYYKAHAHRPKFCTGPIDIRVVMDYRCYVPGGRIGTDFPPGLRACMSALARHRVPEIMQRYGFSSRKPAEILKRRSRDMLSLGFEGALEGSPPRSAPRYVYKPQPPCCGVVLDMRGVPRCAQCWRPIIELAKDSVRDNMTVANKKEVLVGPNE